MATLLLTAGASALANAAGFGKLTGSLLLAGASIAGRLIDGFLFQSGQETRNEGPRLGEYEITSSTEGNPIRRAYGRVRIGGELIWAAEFEERSTTTTEGGKGGGPKVTTTTYSYYATFAVALCEGEVDFLNRVWADGKEVDLDAITYRFYRGTESQTPDPAIEAVEGAGNAPAYRGTCYVVFEDLPIDDYGRRIPQLTFEIFRGPPGDTLEKKIEGVCIIPASTEFGYDTTVVRKQNVSTGGSVTGEDRVNNNVRDEVTDWALSLDHLDRVMPNVDKAVLVTAWFGDDLRCAECQIMPRVDSKDKQTTPISWSVAGLTRATADAVSQVGGRPAYGGSPNDASVVRAIQDLKDRGFFVVILPFILMDVPDGNVLPDPYDASSPGLGQSAYPWRGRITIDPAIGVTGSPDKTATAATQVSDFMGSADPADVSSSGTTVTWTGPSATDWGYRKFILHHAHLAKLGGADAFLIGSEMVQMTSARSDADTFPFVDELVTLLGECRTILGSGVKIGYAADWSEYHSYRPGDGSGDVYFNLDKLWSDSDCDFVGIDNYLPLSDWRDGNGHLDFDPSSGHTTVYDVDYLKGNIEGGEYYEWFYASAADRDAQIRSPIADGLYGEPWVYRNKDLAGWWSSAHHDRPGGVRANLVPDGGAPVVWNNPWGSPPVLTPITDTVLGIFSGGVNVANSQTRQSRIRSSPFDVFAGRTYEVRAWYRAPDGTATVAPSNLVVAGGAAGALTVANDFGNTIEELENIDHGAGVYEFRARIIVSNDASSLFQFLPGQNGVGKSVDAIAAEVLELGASTTGWVPESKPIWFIELGCPALDKASNQPNVFYDPKSSESSLPYFSSGERDDVIQRSFLTAWHEWIDSADNPASSVYGGKMVDPDRVFVWTWDARPFPTYPLDTEAWGDAENWRFGHWLSARLGMVYVPDLMDHMASDYGFADGDFTEAYGTVDGYVIDRTMSLRDAWGDLSLFCFFDLIESGDRVIARTRHGAPSLLTVDDDDLVARDDRGPVRATRKQETELPIKARLRYIDSERAYQQGVVAAEWLSGESDRVSEATLSIVVDQPRAQKAVDIWLADARAAREQFDFGLMPRHLAYEPGDILTIPLGGFTRPVRLIEVQDAYGREASATSFIDTALAASAPAARALPGTTRPPLRSAPLLVVMDLPLLRDDDNPSAAYIAAHADPWPGAVAVWRSPETTGYSLNTLIPVRAVVGETRTALPARDPAIYDRGTLRIELYTGAPESVSRLAALGGANAFAVETPSGWEVLVAERVTLVSAGVYDLSMMIRGARGTEHAMGDPTPVGSRVVWLDGGGVSQLDMTVDELGRAFHYSAGPANTSVGSPLHATQVATVEGEGLEPYPPVHVAATANGGDITISWIRRTRIGGDLWRTDGQVPLGETRERYRVTILSEADVVLRKATVSDATEYVWTAAQQSTDGFSGGLFKVRVQQISDEIGPGNFRTVTLRG